MFVGFPTNESVIIANASIYVLSDCYRLGAEPNEETTLPTFVDMPTGNS